MTGWMTTKTEHSILEIGLSLTNPPAQRRTVMATEIQEAMSDVLPAGWKLRPSGQLLHPRDEVALVGRVLEDLSEVRAAATEAVTAKSTQGGW